MKADTCRSRSENEYTYVQVRLSNRKARKIWSVGWQEIWKSGKDKQTKLLWMSCYVVIISHRVFISQNVIIFSFIDTYMHVHKRDVLLYLPHCCVFYLLEGEKIWNKKLTCSGMWFGNCPTVDSSSALTCNAHHNCTAHLILLYWFSWNCTMIHIKN